MNLYATKNPVWFPSGVSFELSHRLCAGRKFGFAACNCGDEYIQPGDLPVKKIHVQFPRQDAFTAQLIARFGQFAKPELKLHFFGDLVFLQFAAVLKCRKQCIDCDQPGIDFRELRLVFGR